jgi:membrane protein DedA with SNARE-associated domain
VSRWGLDRVSVRARQGTVPCTAPWEGTLTAAQLVAAAAAAVFVALATYRVYQRRPLRAAVGLTVAALLLLYAANVVTGVPDPQAEIERSGDALGGWAYLVVAGMAFFETGAPPFTVVFPGEWGVAFGGLLARRGVIELVPLVLVVWATSLLGDSWSFYLGRRFGRGYLVRQGTRFGVTHERLEALDAFFARWGAATVAVGRLVPFARPLVPLVAGASGWPYRRFLPWNVLGTGVFAVAFTVLGYAAYATAERVVEIGGDTAVIVIPVALALAALAILVRRRVSVARE